MSQNELIRTIEIKDRSGRVVGTKEVVTYRGLLSKAHEEGLTQVKTKLLQIPDDGNGRTAISKALVETGKGRFEAIGDASPENVNSFIVPHLIRMAETRAKARALRDAVNVGVVSFEELDGDNGFSEEPSHGTGNGTKTGQPVQARGAERIVNDNGKMTDAQRRYLFRLLAGQGIEGEAAHEYLKDKLGVRALQEASRKEASSLIDGLLNGNEEVADAHA
jgi:hypothetical protein